ncbi:MAG: MotA/TolQ/ExbB proton channel family protein [Myxococcota bacterium]|nr:MotA/TolQ/ExbB proton channel family protein [Myxococcota bacterium]
MKNTLTAFLAQAAEGASPPPATGAKAGTIAELTALILEASPIVKGVIFLLFLFIFACVFIIVYKYISLRRAQGQTHRFMEVFWHSKRLDEIYNAAEDLRRSPISQLFKAGYIELSKLKGSKGEDARIDETHVGDIGNVERALRRASTAEITHLESLVPFLATTGSTAPFVGLFGTVIGIMISFMQISASGSAGMEVVSQGISEALIATAIGLMAAIPAVIAYNYFLRRIRVLSSEMDNFSSDFLNIVKRHFLK